MSSPVPLGPDDLVWDHMSRPRDEDPVVRVHAAAAAGFAGIGLFVRRWMAMRQDPDHVERFEGALAETGIRLAGMEVARLGRPRDEEAEAFEAAAWELADRFGCPYLQAIGWEVGTPEAGAPLLAALCDRAADHGVRVGLEFVPAITDIEKASQALEMVERADRPNAGFCVDSWHLTRSTNDMSEVLRFPGDRVYAVQLNDGTIEPEDDDYLTDTVTNRRSPGRGEFALVEMIENLDAIGVTCPLGLEVCSSALWALPASEAATRVHDDMRHILARARPSTARSTP